jgi:glycosyltransferase involved in cell wall biosynthesis
VVEHGIVDPGERYTGELPRAAVVVNEARRRGRVTGTDLLDRFAEAAPLDLFGIDARNAPSAARGIEDLPQAALHDAMARRRAYLHPIRWTSLGLSLLEAMQLGMPVVALGTTEVHEAVPPAAGVVSTRLDVLRGALRRLMADPEEAAERGRAARAAAVERYGLGRFLADWDAIMRERAGAERGLEEAVR